LCSALKSRYSVTVQTSIPFSEQGISLRRLATQYKIGTGAGPKPKPNSSKKFIVKIQTMNQNTHPLQSLAVYDKSLTIYCSIQSQEIFSVIMECGVLEGSKLTSKKAFFWAVFAERGEKLTIFLDHLAPYQEW